MDSSLDSALIDQLQPLYAEPDFDVLFERLTLNETKSTRFLLKMELNRLWSPCIRIMDMRSRGYPCTAIMHQGIQHFLGENDRETFENALANYKDRYTIGVYETVIANATPRNSNARQTKPAKNLDRLKIRTIRFGGYQQGREERIHYSTQVKVLFEDGNSVEARTSNLSVNGIRICLLQPYDYEIGEQCQIIFSGMHKDTNNEIIKEPVLYQIRGEDQTDQQTWLRLSCEESSFVFKDFISDFIERNKSKYKVSIDFAFTATEIKGFEQFYLPRLTGLPLFFSHNETVKLEYVLKTENNQSEIEYWRNDKNEELLSGLFSTTRMNQLIHALPEQHATLIYCFTHTIKGHIYFFSATEQELEEKGLKALFFSVGSKRPSWRIYKLDIAICDEKLNLDNLIDTAVSNPQYQQGLIHELQEIKYLGQLTPINTELQLNEYLAIQSDENDANLLRSFGHAAKTDPFKIEALHYVQLRREPRYFHKTPVRIETKEHAVTGWTRDISTMGMQIELETPLICNKHENVSISLPKLQDLIKEMNLSVLPYRVVHSNNMRTVLHLQITGDEEKHVGRKFFQMLIEQNQQKLTTTPEQRHQRGLANSLRNLFVTQKFNYALFIDKYYATNLGIMGIGKHPQSLDHLLLNESQTEANLQPLFKDEMFKKALMNPLNQTKREFRPFIVELNIAKIRTSDVNFRYEIKLDDEWISVEEKTAFIKKSLNNGEFYSIQLHISKTGRPDMEFLAKELDYIAKYAIHKAKKLEEQLWNVTGVCDIIDTTEATLSRYYLMTQA